MSKSTSPMSNRRVFTMNRIITLVLTWGTIFMLLATLTAIASAQPQAAGAHDGNGITTTSTQTCTVFPQPLPTYGIFGVSYITPFHAHYADLAPCPFSNTNNTFVFTTQAGGFLVDENSIQVVRNGSVQTRVHSTFDFNFYTLSKISLVGLNVEYLITFLTPVQNWEVIRVSFDYAY